MGLDQYAVAKFPEPAGDSLMTWRKHNRLQGWMRELWYEKGNKGEFNCVDLELSLEDIEDLEDAIHKKNLPLTTGFFFGDDSYAEYEEYYLEDDLKFIRDAKKAIAEGKIVIYSCWW